MTTLTLTQPHSLPQLHDELLAALPALAPTLRVEGPSLGARVKTAEYAEWLKTREGEVPVQLYVELPPDPPNTVHITVPDDADQQSVAAVVAAHDPSVVGTSEQRETERTEATTDVLNSAAAIIRRMDEIKVGGLLFTATQTKEAQVDMANAVGKITRYLRAQAE